MLNIDLDIGSNDGWLGFGGGYLGSILSGIVVYSIARYQKLEEKEYKNSVYELLPYFNIDGININKEDKNFF